MYLDRKTTGNRIATRRKNLKMNQEQLASKLNISNNHLSSIERGHSSMSVNLLCKLCDALNVTPDYLLLGDMRSNNVPQNVVDTLRLCTDEQIAFVSEIVQLVLNKRYGAVFGDKTK